MHYPCFIHAFTMLYPYTVPLPKSFLVLIIPCHFYLLLTNKVNVLFNRNFDDRIVDYNEVYGIILFGFVGHF
jgi:hypothetical protein